MNPRKEKTLLIGIALAFICMMLALSANADQPGDVRGCVATYIPNTGKYIFEPFLKVQDKESPAEDGAPEIWGFRPWNLEPPDKEGKTHPVNIREDRFIELNIFKQVGPRKVKCPEGLW